MKKIKHFIPLFCFWLAMIQPAQAQTAAATQDGKMLYGFMLKDGYVAIKLSKYITGHLYTDEMSINGIKGKFILDTGAGGTVIEESRKDKFRIKTEASLEKAVGAGGSGMNISVSMNNRVELGAYIVPQMMLRTMDLDHVNNAFRQLGIPEVDGIIGADLLYNGNAVIDYVNMILYLKK